MFASIKDFFKKVKEKITFLMGEAKLFIEDSKKKFHNLYQTNYNTGMYHLEHGNLWDATFRFKIIKRFWPNKLEAQCKYAYCLILQGFNSDAAKLLNEILKKDSNCNEAKELLRKIEKNETTKMIADYNAKFNRNAEAKTEKDDSDK